MIFYKDKSFCNGRLICKNFKKCGNCPTNNDMYEAVKTKNTISYYHCKNQKCFKPYYGDE